VTNPLKAPSDPLHKMPRLGVVLEQNAYRLDRDDVGVSWSLIGVKERRYERFVVRTPWIQPGDDLEEIAVRHLGPLVRRGDCAFVSEKAAVLATGRGIPAADVRPGLVARTLARWVRPVGDSRGISIPEKMQLVIDLVGLPRVLLAALAAAVTRPFGIRGAFYVVAGRNARGMDGMRSPFEHLLLPPLHPDEARALATRIAARLGVAVAIVDINDRGGCVRAVSTSGPPSELLCAILRDNPMGQRDARTPLGITRLAA
jgi:hypothetical protein